MSEPLSETETMASTTTTETTEEEEEEEQEDANGEAESKAQDNEEEEEEEDQPILKFSRMADCNHLKKILENDAISCVAVHSRFICVGTYFGNVRLLDHQGNQILPTLDTGVISFPSHLVSVSQISVDAKGEYIATCSSDGTINVFGLYANDFNHKLTVGQPVNAIALDPHHPNAPAATVGHNASPALSSAASSSTRRFIAGSSCLQLYEQRTFLKSLRPTLLTEAEGYVSAIAWCGQFVASASGLGVRVYDLHERCSLGFFRWEEPAAGEGRITDFRCNLRWASANTLLIGWVDTIRVCVIRKRNATEVARFGQPGLIVDPVATFQTDFFVAGLAPLAAGDQINQIIVLGQLKERDERGKAQRPIVCVMQYTSCKYLPICTSSITMRGYEEYAARDYHLECLRDEHTYYIVAPKDLIVATECENDDRIQWLINHRKFEEALAAISVHGGRYSQISVARLYLNHLLEADECEQAANICRRWFGDDKALWEEEVYKFVNRKQLRCIKAYLPRSAECRLSPHIYEMVLYEYLKTDTAGFRELIHEWPTALYNTTVVINAIMEHLALVAQTINAEDKAMLFEALAFLYTSERRFDSALNTYLLLKQPEVFNLIRTHSLYALIETRIVPLMQLDRRRTIDLLLERHFEPATVVQQLNQHEELLYHYLDALTKVNRSGQFDERLIELYVRFNRDQLLPFLRRAQNYNILAVLRLCRQRGFYKEMVYLLSCAGNNSEALHVYLDQMHDFAGALEFCKRNDDNDLWMELIEYALRAKPELQLLRQLMVGVVGYLDPCVLVERIGAQVEVQGLQQSLVQMLGEQSLQVAIRAKCNDILMTDYFGLHRKVLKAERRGQRVDGEAVCGRCGKALLGKDAQQLRGLVAFNCRHTFHADCHADEQFCMICKTKQVGPAPTTSTSGPAAKSTLDTT